MDFTILFHYHHYPFSFFKRFIDRLADARSIFYISNDSVHYDFDVMNLVTIDLHFSRDVLNLAVYSNLCISRLAHLLEQFTIVTLSSFYDRRQEEQLLIFEILK